MHQALTIAFLTMLTLCCWIGTAGAWRMREPTQALHYLSVPATIGAVSLTIAIYLATGWSSATVKTILITAVLTASNSIGTHAAARAIRSRRLGHWKPRKEDPVEFVPRRRQS